MTPCPAEQGGCGVCPIFRDLGELQIPLRPEREEGMGFQRWVGCWAGWTAKLVHGLWVIVSHLRAPQCAVL